MNVPSVYRGGSGFIYALHPLVKLSFSLVFVIATGAVHTYTALFLLSAILLAGAAAAKVYPLELLRILRPFLFLLAFTFIVQLFLTHTGSFMIPTAGTAQTATFYTIRMALMIGFSAIFAIITPPIDIVKVFYLLFTPLKLFKVSPADMALSMLIALRFIPLLFSEGEKIMDSQRLKGILPLKGESGGRLKIIRASASLVVPLFVRTFNYASQIAITLQFRRHDKAFFALPRLKFVDLLTITSMIAISTGIYVIP